MVKKYPTILKLPQREINRQLYEMILTKLSDSGIARLESLINGIGYTTSMLQSIIGNKEILGSVLYRIHQSELKIGDLELKIGNDDTVGSILYRIKQLEVKNGIEPELKLNNSEPENKGTKTKESETKEPANKGTKTKKEE